MKFFHFFFISHRISSLGCLPSWQCTKQSLEMWHETGYSITRAVFKCRRPSEDENMDLPGSFWGGSACRKRSACETPSTLCCCQLCGVEKRSAVLWFVDLLQIILPSRCPEEDHTPTPPPGLQAACCHPPPLMCPTTCAMLHLLPHCAHTHTHICCLSGLNNSNSAGVNSLGGVLFCRLMLAFFLTVTVKPTPQTAAAAILEISGIPSFGLSIYTHQGR